MCTCIAWEPEKSHDGIGAQVLRIIDSFSVAKFLNLGFVYKPIVHFERNPGDGLEESQKKEFLFQLEKVLDLNEYSCLNIHEKRSVKLSRFYTSLLITKIYFGCRRRYNLVKKRNELIVISNLDLITHKKPNIRSSFVSSRFKKRENLVMGSPIQIHLHIRRGWITSQSLNNRFVPTSWYLSILDTLQDLLDHYGVRAEITLHTDVTRQDEVWDISDISKGTRKYLVDNGVILGTDSYVSLNYEEFTKTMSKVRNLRVISGISPIEAWNLMSKADILILGKSTFSYVGALLCNPRIVISPQGFLGVLSNWFSVNARGELDSNAINCVQQLIASKRKL